MAENEVGDPDVNNKGREGACQRRAMHVPQPKFPRLPWVNPKEQRSDTPCYTCRRRRVICDKVLPTCRKCRVAGKQCLGYKKPLTWVQGVASRGKMMGLTFDDISGREQRKEPSTGVGMIEVPGADLSRIDERKKACAVQDMDSLQSQFDQLLSPIRLRESIDLSIGSADQISGNCHVILDHNPSSEAPITARQGPEFAVRDQMSIRPALVDPVFHRVDTIERHYLSYYDQRFCKLMVLYDVPHKNPYRRLIPLVCKSPVLRSAMSAVAACHYMHSYHQKSFNKTFEQRLGARRSSSKAHEVFSKSPDPTIRTIYEQFLMFKHRTLYLLGQSLADPKEKNDETTIASILLLITLDMVESGQGDWKVHVDGAIGLIKNRLGQVAGNLNVDDKSTLVPTLCDSFNSFLTSTCMTIDIMGSTLARSGTWSEPIYSQLMMSPALLSQTEQIMFTGCPGYLLRIILFITSVRHASPSPGQSAAGFALADGITVTPQDDLPSILAYIEEFDPTSWALEMQSRIPESTPSSPSPASPTFPSPSLSSSTAEHPTFFSESFTSPFHLASAYKIAITLYATRVLLHQSPQDRSFATEVTALLSHLSRIPTTSELLKCTLWPMFIAGSECRNPEQRAWIQRSLQQLWNEYLSANIKVAGSALEVIWGGDEEEGDWIQFLDRSNFSWLFI